MAKPQRPGGCSGENDDGVLPRVHYRRIDLPAVMPVQITQFTKNPKGDLDFLLVLKHRDSGIVVVPVVRVSLTVASSRRGEMESYTVSARV